MDAFNFAAERVRPVGRRGDLHGPWHERQDTPFAADFLFSADENGLLADVDGLLADVDGFPADVDGFPEGVEGFWRM